MGRRPRRVARALLLAAAVAIACTAGSGVRAAQAGAGALGSGWFPTDWVRSVHNPVFTFSPAAGDSYTDRIFPSVMRVDDKIIGALDRWYMWYWRHGLDDTDAHGGRMGLLTAPTLDGPWTDRGFVTTAPLLPPSNPGYWQTGGDVVWSPTYQKFYAVPHTVPMDTYLLESSDGVNWSVSSTTPILSTGPGAYDAKETGYGRLIRAPGATESWIWLYRSGAYCSGCSNNAEYYTLSVATANDIHGPWTKDPANPVYDPYRGHVNQGSQGALIGIATFVRYDGYYQLMWSESLGNAYLTRSTDLHTWEDYASASAPGGAPFGQDFPVAAQFSPGGAPGEVVIDGYTSVWDDQNSAWALIYFGWDAANLLDEPGVPGHVTVNVARSATGGTPPG